MLLTVALLGCKSEPTPVIRPSFTEELAAVVGDTPGFGAAVVDLDGVAFQGVVGLRRADRPDNAISPDDAWHLGSNTKSMTAALLMILAEDGGIGLDTTIGSLWPQAHVAHHGTTLGELLSHTGGLSGNLPADHPDVWNALGGVDPGQAREDAVALLLSRPPDATHGSFTYSNAGYIVVGTALQLHTGQSWEALMEARLFDPLQMRCGFGPPPTPAPWGHLSQGGERTPLSPDLLGADNPAGLGPAGTVHCTLEDWGRYATWVLWGAGSGRSAFGPAVAWDELLPTPADGYAGGWGALSNGTLSHDGSNTLWYARINLNPATGRGELMVTNAGDEGAFETIEALDAFLDGWEREVEPVQPL